MAKLPNGRPSAKTVNIGYAAFKQLYRQYARKRCLQYLYWMDRKKFLGNGALSILALAGLDRFSADRVPKEMIVPDRLAEGDWIGVTSPAGYITAEEIDPAVSLLKQWGFRVKIGNTIGKRDFNFGGTDHERLNDFQQMLDDPGLKAVLCARGGYGAVRIVDQLRWEQFRKFPKWIVGFSDITVFHAHLSRQVGAASIHSKMCNSFPDDWQKADQLQMATILSIRDALLGIPFNMQIEGSEKSRPGHAEAILVGGNLKTIESLAGSRSDMLTDGRILFVEDTGEYRYSVDRMFWNLKRSGKLSNLAGLIVGGFRLKPDDPGEEFGRELEDIVLEKVREYAYPVCFNFPVGHQKNNFALKCGVRHKLVVNKSETRLTELT